MRQLAAEEHKVAWFEIFDRVADEPLALAFDNEGQFDFWMVVPEEGKARDIVLETSEGGLVLGEDFFWNSFHEKYYIG